MHVEALLNKVKLAGPAGQTGGKGDRGPEGSQGPAGPPGSDGQPGRQGDFGPQVNSAICCFNRQISVVAPDRGRESVCALHTTSMGTGQMQRAGNAEHGEYAFICCCTRQKEGANVRITPGSTMLTARPKWAGPFENFSSVYQK